MHVAASRLEQWLAWHLLTTVLDRDRGGSGSESAPDFRALLESAADVFPGDGASGVSASVWAAVARASSPSFLHGGELGGFPIGTGRFDISGGARDVGVPESVPDAYRPLIERAARRYGLDPRLVAAVVEVESGFRPDAVSPAGAKGLMQLTDATARAAGVSDPFDPVANVMGGAKYLSALIRRYGGETSVALAAYNAGPGRVDRAGIRTEADLAARAHLLPSETVEYVGKVLRTAFGPV